MKYAGIRFQKIEAEKFEEAKSGNINVNSNFNLGKVKKEEDLTKDSDKPVFSFEFTYSIKYEEFAEISFKGTVYIEIHDKKMIKAFEEEDSRVADNDLRKLILDVVLARTHVESLHLEEKLGLPFHIQSPKVKFGNN
ncbi:MAG: hypothetical protein AABX93_03240 [Nanoarchaeota archaeon]